MTTTRIAHVNTYNSSSGNVTCHSHTGDLDFWRTGTILISASGHGTCRPNLKHFDIILATNNGVTSGCKLFITYDETVAGSIKPVTGVSVIAGAIAKQALSLHLGPLNLTSRCAIVRAWPISFERARWHSWLPKLELDISLVLFDRFRFSASTASVSPEPVEIEPAALDVELLGGDPIAPNGATPHAAPPAPA